MLGPLLHIVLKQMTVLPCEYLVFKQMKTLINLLLNT